MKTKIYFKLTVIMLAFLFAAHQSNAQVPQFDQVAEMLKAGQTEANTFLENYLLPIGKAWGNDLNGGWYNTAANHKLLGVDLTFSFNFAQTPDIDKVFDIAALGLTKIASTTSSTEFPAITNGDITNTFEIKETVQATDPNTGQPINDPVTGQPIEVPVPLLDEQTLRGFNVPVGIPLPTLNLGVGLIKGTDLIVRYIPTLNMKKFGSLGLWGVGVKHDILQWLPIVDKVPFLRASVFAGYTSFSLNTPINYVPEVDIPNPNLSLPDNQEMNMAMSGMHVALLVGAKLPVVNPYVSVGLSQSKFNMTLDGDYAIPVPTVSVAGANVTSGTTLSADAVLTDPINIESKNKLAPAIAAGLRIKLAVITLHGQYTIQEYPTITAGFGISFR